LLEGVAWKAGTAGSRGPRRGDAPGLPDWKPFYYLLEDAVNVMLVNPRDGAVNLAGAQRDRGVQGLGGLGVGGMGQAAAVSPVTSLKTANRRVMSVR